MDTSGVIVLQQVFQGMENFWDVFFLLITLVGEETFLAAAAFGVYWLADRDRGETILLILFASQIINALMKSIFQVPRPFLVEEQVRYVQVQYLLLNTVKLRSSFSFPSGHAQLGSTFLFAIARYFPNRKSRAALFLIPLLMLSRVYLGVHYPRDVLVGAALGLLMVTAFMLFKLESGYQGQKLGLVLVIVGALASLRFPSTDLSRGLSLGAGALLGLFLERRFLGFPPPQGRWGKFKRASGGIVFILTLYLLIGLLPKSVLTLVVGHMVLGFTAAFLWPWACTRLRL